MQENEIDSQKGIYQKKKEKDSFLLMEELC